MVVPASAVASGRLYGLTGCMDHGSCVPWISPRVEKGTSIPHMAGNRPGIFVFLAYQVASIYPVSDCAALFLRRGRIPGIGL